MVRTGLPDQSFSLNLLQTFTDCIAYSPGEWPQAGGFQASTCREPPRQHAMGLDAHLTCSIWSSDISLMFQAKKRQHNWWILVGWCAARKTLGAQEPGGRLCQCLPHCGGLRKGRFRSCQIMSDPSKKDGFRCYKASGAIVATSSSLHPFWSILIHGHADLLFFVARGSRCAAAPFSSIPWVSASGWKPWETMGENPHRRDRMMAGNRRSLGLGPPKMAAIPRCHKGESMMKAGHISDYIHVSCMYIYIYISYCNMHPYA